MFVHTEHVKDIDLFLLCVFCIACEVYQVGMYFEVDSLLYHKVE